MKLGWIFCLIFASVCVAASASNCETLLADLELPKRVKTDGRHDVAKWQDIDKLLNELAQVSEGTNCNFTFSEIFRIEEESPLFPLTNSVIRVVPEESLKGVPVFNKEAEKIGSFAGQVRYERTGGLYARRSYTIYYFQYEREDGKLDSAGGGGQLLLDRYLTKWGDIKANVAISGKQ